MYVIARTNSGRVTVLHLVGRDTGTTACGRDVSPFSRSYTKERLEAVACKAQGCKQVPVNG